MEYWTVKAACLQIDANFHKDFETKFKSYILTRDQRKLFTQSALTIHLNYQIHNVCQNVFFEKALN
jgi:hypothetical protein